MIIRMLSLINHEESDEIDQELLWYCLKQGCENLVILVVESYALVSSTMII